MTAFAIGAQRKTIEREIGYLTVWPTFVSNWKNSYGLKFRYLKNRSTSR